MTSLDYWMLQVLDDILYDRIQLGLKTHIPNDNRFENCVGQPTLIRKRINEMKEELSEEGFKALEIERIGEL